MKYEGFKTFEAWNEAHAIQQLCKWLEKKGQGTDDWESIAKDMLNKDAYSGGNKEVGEFYEYGNGVYAHGISGNVPEITGDYGYRFRIEINDVEETETFGKIKVKFYVSIDEWSSKGQTA